MQLLYVPQIFLGEKLRIFIVVVPREKQGTLRRYRTGGQHEKSPCRGENPESCHSSSVLGLQGLSNPDLLCNLVRSWRFFLIIWKIRELDLWAPFQCHSLLTLLLTFSMHLEIPLFLQDLMAIDALSCWCTHLNH